MSGINAFFDDFIINIIWLFDEVVWEAGQIGQKTILLL
jgi:hypothetical protein